MSLQRFLTLVVVAALLCPLQAAEQLRILVLEGDRAINNIHTQEAVAPVVEVRDASGRPVEGAEVIFEGPQSGAGAVFGKAGKESVRTNHQGQATPSSYRPNARTGRFSIRVTATMGDRSGTAAITQMNSADRLSSAEPPRKSGGKMKWILIGVAAAGAAAVTAGVASRNSTTDVPLSAGRVVLSGPR